MEFPNHVLYPLKISFTLSNGGDPDEMPHYVAFHLGLHCQSKYFILYTKDTSVYKGFLGVNCFV